MSKVTLEHLEAALSLRELADFIDLPTDYFAVAARLDDVSCEEEIQFSADAIRRIAGAVALAAESRNSRKEPMEFEPVEKLSQKVASRHFNDEKHGGVAWLMGEQNMFDIPDDVVRCNNNGGQSMKHTFDSRARQAGMSYSKQFFLELKFCNPETAAYAGFDLVADRAMSNPRFSMADAVGIVHSHRAIFVDFSRGEFDPIDWYASEPDLDDHDYFNMPHAFDDKCRRQRLSYAAQCLAFALHPSFLAMSMQNPWQCDLITSWYDGSLARLVGMFALANMEIAGLPPEFWETRM